ncbi:hypothetical protein ACVDG5_021165 [Mesorhizobium sp. ORM6]
MGAIDKLLRHTSVDVDLEPSRRKTEVKVTLVPPPLGADENAAGAGAETE